MQWNICNDLSHTLNDKNFDFWIQQSSLYPRNVGQHYYNNTAANWDRIVYHHIKTGFVKHTKIMHFRTYTSQRYLSWHLFYTVFVTCIWRNMHVFFSPPDPWHKLLGALLHLMLVEPILTCYLFLHNKKHNSNNHKWQTAKRFLPTSSTSAITENTFTAMAFATSKTKKRLEAERDELCAEETLYSCRSTSLRRCRRFLMSVWKPSTSSARRRSRSW